MTHKMAQAKIFVFIVFCMILPSTVVVGLPEQGVWNIQMSEVSISTASKHFFQY